MTEGSNQTPQEQTEQSPQYEYQQETPNEVTQAVQNAEQSVTASADEVNAAKERAAFETYVQNSGDSIPENFADAGSWFDSLKEAQKNYTQGQQEIADLKKQYSEYGTVNPNTIATPEEPTEPVSELSDAKGTEELRIPKKAEEPSEDATEEAVGYTPVNQEDWDNWSYEVAATGSLSDETKENIMQRTGLNESMLGDFLAGQKAKMRESYQEAASVVGGLDRLQDMLKWASSTLPEQEQHHINAGMATPTMREVTLRGLASKYDSAIASSPQAKEPEVPANRENRSVANTTYSSYTTRREFLGDRNNPRFSMEPKFREAVEQRMMRTNWNTLSE